ncbi:MAG TPA: SDR family oxidoreductase [Pedomonas sp.]|uniref:SDR family oxidoreductase n=1 Tax=Pedomonas sp. TaxID=2976421 RepID=UPI002F41D3D3
MTVGEFPPGCVLIFGKMPGTAGAVAKCFAKAGSAFALSYTQAPGLEEWQGLQDIDCRATFHCMDARIPGEAEAIIDQVIAAHERIHTVVWSVYDMAETCALPGAEEDWGPRLYSHTQGISRLVTAVRPHFRAAGGGSFVLLLAQECATASASTGLAASLKAASETMIRSITEAEGGFGVRANSVVLDLQSETPGQRQASDEPAAPTGAGIGNRRQAPAACSLLEEAGHSAVFLASRHAARVTGQQIRLSV